MFKHLWNLQYIKFNEIIFGAYFDSLVLLLDIVIIQIHGIGVRGDINFQIYLDFNTHE